MADFNSAYEAAVRLERELSTALHLIDESRERLSPERKNELSRQVRYLLDLVSRLETSISSQQINRAELWKRRVQSVRTNANKVDQMFRGYMTEDLKRSKYDEERAELFGAHDEHTVSIGTLTDTRGSLKRSHDMVDQYTAITAATLGALRNQRERLKGARKVLLDIAGSLGFSASVMRMIERRTSGDRMLVYAGMAVTLLILYLCWRYIS